MAYDPTTGQPIYNAPTVIAPPTAQAVYSSPNITQAVTAPVARPNLADPYALQDYYMNSPEMQAAKASIQAGQGQINQVNQGLRTTTTALENQNIGAMGSTGASVNLIGGQTARARSLAGNELSALGETQNANLAYLNTLQADAQNKYAIAQQERSQLQDLIRTTGGKAGISYTDNYESALQKASNYEDKLRKEEEKKAKDATDSNYKSELKAQLRALGLSTKTDKGGTLDIKGMEKKLEKYNKQALAEAKALKNKASGVKSVNGNNDLPTTYSETTQRQMINEAIAGGEDWNGIAKTFDALGIDTNQGSVMDNYLKQKFGY